jgi:hypothetical protein
MELVVLKIGVCDAHVCISILVHLVRVHFFCRTPYHLQIMFALYLIHTNVVSRRFIDHTGFIHLCRFNSTIFLLDVNQPCALIIAFLDLFLLDVCSIVKVLALDLLLPSLF